MDFILFLWEKKTNYSDYRLYYYENGITYKVPKLGNSTLVEPFNNELSIIDVNNSKLAKKDIQSFNYSLRRITGNKFSRYMAEILFYSNLNKKIFNTNLIKK